MAPATIFDGQSRQVLRIVLSNPAAGEVATVQWSAVGLLFEQTPGTPLTGTAACGLFAELDIYKDTNASGAFEPAADTLVASLLGFPLGADGALQAPLDGSDPADLRAASGTSATYFVVARLSDNASAGNPNQFRITHLINGPNSSTVVDAISDAPLSMNVGADTASSTVTAIFDNPPTTTGIGNVKALDPAKQSSVALFPAFHDVEDAPAQMSYAVLGNTNPSLFNFVGIDPTTGILTLDYVSNARGASQLTIQATDTAGKSVSATFTAIAAPIATYPDFANLYLGGSGPPGNDNNGSGVANLLKYAFFLDPANAGDRVGLPRLQPVGSSRLISHRRPKFATDLLYRYEYSQDLFTWIPAAEGVQYVSNTIDMDDGSLRTDLLLIVKGPKGFLRTTVELVAAPSPAPPLFAPSVSPPPPSPAGAPAMAATAPSPPVIHPIHSSVVFPLETVVADNSTPGFQSFPMAVIAADTDGDGLKDIIVASLDNKIAWYKNLGNGSFSSLRLVTTSAVSVKTIAVADVDGDNIPDLLSASSSDNKIAWYKNLGSGVFGPQQIISSTAINARVVAVGDVDGDGRVDVISGSSGVFPNTDSQLMWYRNLGAGTFADAQFISSGSWAPASMVTGDFDHDGKLDFAVASINDNSVAFYKGNGAGAFTRSLLSNNEPRAVSICSADIDGDGWLDLVSSATFGGKITAFKNNQDGTFTAIPISAVPNAKGCFWVTAADLNADGNPDIVSAWLTPIGVSTGSRVAWYQNQGAGNFGDPTSNESVVSTNGYDAISVATADFNLDGTLDIVATWQSSNKVSVFLNRGGQIAFASADTAPSTIAEAQRDDLLRIAVSSRGLAGDDNAQLATLKLLFEKSPGVPMTTAEANALIENLYIYADTNNSGTFEPAIDKLVGSVFYLTLVSGNLTVPMAFCDSPSTQIAPGATRNYFVVAQMSASASTQNPNAFRVTHVGQGVGRSTATDALSGSLLSVEPAVNADGPSSLVTAVANVAPVSGGIPNVVVFDTVAPSQILLTSYFNDVEDGAANLQYALTANSNPGLLAFAGIDPATKRLTLKYRSGISGNTTLAVRATDTMGKSVTSSFTVTVALSDTIGNWANIHGVPGTPDAATLKQYAFTLNPAAGDVAGLPHIVADGYAKILSYEKQRWATDLLYRYEISADLLSWAPAVNGVHYYEFDTPLANGVVRGDLVFLVDWPRAFLRVQATLLP